MQGYVQCSIKEILFPTRIRGESLLALKNEAKEESEMSNSLDTKENSNMRDEFQGAFYQMKVDNTRCFMRDIFIGIIYGNEKSKEIKDFAHLKTKFFEEKLILSFDNEVLKELDSKLIRQSNTMRN